MHIYMVPTQVPKTFLMGPECNISFTYKICFGKEHNVEI